MRSRCGVRQNRAQCGLASLALILPLCGQSTLGQTPTPPTASASGEAALFEELPVVEAATLHTQTLEEAPASVTVVTAEEIRRYGYRTLADVLRNVRGFYVTSDRMYHYSGTRGLALPGDYNSRLLVMLNGHPLTENIYNSNNFFAQDFGLDMDLVERIEIIRGPSSALYGSNGILASINVVTVSPVDSPQARVSSETGSFGEKKMHVSSSTYLGKGANLLVSASVFNNGGRSLFFPDYDSPETNNGIGEGIDADRGYHTFANLVRGKWTLTSYFNSREARTPAVGGGTVFNSSGARIRDSRNFVGSSYSTTIGENGKLRWQLFYDQYRYNDRYDYPWDDAGTIQDNRTWNWGDWVNTQIPYSFPVR